MQCSMRRRPEASRVSSCYGLLAACCEFGTLVAPWAFAAPPSALPNVPSPQRSACPSSRHLQVRLAQPPPTEPQPLPSGTYPAMEALAWVRDSHKRPATAGGGGAAPPAGRTVVSGAPAVLPPPAKKAKKLVWKRDAAAEAPAGPPTQQQQQQQQGGAAAPAAAARQQARPQDEQQQQEQQQPTQHTHDTRAQASSAAAAQQGGKPAPGAAPSAAAQQELERLRHQIAAREARLRQQASAAAAAKAAAADAEAQAQRQKEQRRAKLEAGFTAALAAAQKEAAEAAAAAGLAAVAADSPEVARVLASSDDYALLQLAPGTAAAAIRRRYRCGWQGPRACGAAAAACRAWRGLPGPTWPARRMRRRRLLHVRPLQTQGDGCGAAPRQVQAAAGQGGVPAAGARVSEPGQVRRVMCREAWPNRTSGGLAATLMLHWSALWFDNSSWIHV